MSITEFLGKVNAAILNPLIVLLLIVALVVFLWGIFQFVLHNDDETERERGKRSIVWGLVGMFIMFAVWGIVRLILGTLGIPTSWPF